MFARLLASQKRGPQVNIQQYLLLIVKLVTLLCEVGRSYWAEITVGRGHMYPY